MNNSTRRRQSVTSKPCLILLATLCFAGIVHAQSVSFYETAEEFVGPFPSWKNVRTDYGAKGDGKADDTAAIQKALDDMKTVPRNDWAVLYFPAGVYRITKTLGTLRKDHSDYLGSTLVGEDPATTILLWDGPAGHPMLRFDAWYSKVSRLTFDGRGKANGGLLRAGGFSTYTEHSDLVFKDINGIAMNLGNAEAQGIAETAVLRCKFLRCGEGISTINWNTLDIYVWYCLFEDCGKGIYNRMGNYHCYENVFLRSKEMDVGSMNGMFFAFVNNISIGSKTFLDGYGEYLRGNRVYHPENLPAIRVAGNLTMLDNLVCTKPGATGPAVHCGQSTLAIGNTFTVDRWPIRPDHYPHPNAGTLRRDLDKALDSDPATEFMDVGCNDPGSGHPIAPLTVQWNAPEGGARKVVKFALTSGSDPKLDPRGFRLLCAPTPGGPWTELEAQKGVTFAARQQRKEFAISSPQSAPVFRLEISANASGTPTMRLAEVEFLDEQDRNVLLDAACLITGRNEKWGPYLELDNKLVKAEQIQVPAMVRVPATPPTFHRKVFEVKPGTGDDARELQAQIAAAAAELQTQIDAAARKPVAGESSPSVVVHLPKGVLTLNRTVTVPVPKPVKRIDGTLQTGSLQLVGDGGTENGSVLRYGGGGGPVLRLAGPSRTTLRDFTVSAQGKDGVEALVVEDADQEHGRIYTEQLNASGHIHDMCRTAIHVDGLVKSEVTMICGGFGGCLTGVKARGNPALTADAEAKNQIAFLSGASSHGCRLLDVADGGRFVGETFWYEGDFDYPAALLDLSPASSGRLTLAAASWHMAHDNRFQQTAEKRQPIISVGGFKGLCTVVGTGFDKREKPIVRLAGDGSQATVAIMGSSFVKGGDGWSFGDSWLDQTRPDAQIAVFGCNGAIQANKHADTLPDAALMRKTLEQIRNVRSAPAREHPAGATDLKIFRVGVSGGAGKDAIRFQASPSAAGDDAKRNTDAPISREGRMP